MSGLRQSWQRRLLVGALALVVLAAASALLNGIRSDPDSAAQQVPTRQDCPEREDVLPQGPDQADHPRLSPDAASAVAALGEASTPLPCGALARHGDGEHGSSAHGGGGHHHPLGEVAAPSSTAERRARAAQWDAAVAATAELATPEEAAAAGYAPASSFVPGVGSHWVDWTLIDAPFDPARPSMLLFDTERDPARLAGFSYWVRSETEPQGFTGEVDRWHQHLGLCIVDGWHRREGVPAAAECEGTWLNGSDLWMLHAWVVLEYENPDGPFADRHHALCPNELSTPDALQC